MGLGGFGLSFSLALVHLASALQPPVAMRGMFTYMADAALFEDCVTGRKLPVAMEGDYRALERAYLERRAEAGQALLANVEGRILDRVVMEGPARPTLVVERFVSLSPGESCGTPSGILPFENTRWKLTELNGSAVTPADERREAHLLFQPEGRLGGYDGCNRLFGGYTVEGESIHFGRLGSTMIACAREVRDRELVEALGKASKWRISGSRLELRGARDEILARFEATPPK